MNYNNPNFRDGDESMRKIHIKLSDLEHLIVLAEKDAEKLEERLDAVREHRQQLYTDKDLLVNILDEIENLDRLGVVVL